MLVAKTAVGAGHDVTVFFAGDAVSALRTETLDAANGVGTGSLRQHYDDLVTGPARLFGSAMSAAARGIDAETLAGAVELVKPDRLVELIVEAERVITY
jgi:predicted peroxiredoxin